MSEIFQRLLEKAKEEFNKIMAAPWTKGKTLLKNENITFSGIMSITPTRAKELAYRAGYWVPIL